MDDFLVHIPADLNGKDTFLPLGPFSLSLPQVVILLGSIFLWWGVAKYFLAAPFGLAEGFGMIATCWIPGLSIAFAFGRVRGRPLDMWVSEKVSFHFQPRTFVLKDSKQQLDRSGSVDMYNDRDVEDMIRRLDRPRVVQ